MAHPQKYLVWENGEALVFTRGNPTDRLTVRMSPYRKDLLMALAMTFYEEDLAGRNPLPQEIYRPR